mmetsp:Transcript_14364/g.34753  ORF Transcript_14364/g.34753 Transcript_14364/m.34753 type:complete len:95 (-) Transcript_14364:38-322(-)
MIFYHFQPLGIYDLDQKDILLTGLIFHDESMMDLSTLLQMLPSDRSLFRAVETDFWKDSLSTTLRRRTETNTTTTTNITRTKVKLTLCIDNTAS